MEIIDRAASLAAEAGTAGIPLWIKVVFAAFVLTLISTGLVVWAVIYLARSRRNSSNS